MYEATPLGWRDVRHLDDALLNFPIGFDACPVSPSGIYVDALSACNDSTAPILASVNRCLAERGVE